MPLLSAVQGREVKNEKFETTDDQSRSARVDSTSFELLIFFTCILFV